VLVHECAHHLLHLAKGRRVCLRRAIDSRLRAIRETEADAATFLVLGNLGIEYNCPAYVVWHGGRGKTVLLSFKRILVGARAIPAAIDGRKITLTIPQLEAPPRRRRGGAGERATRRR
jgi:hypothetical protein